MNPLSFLSPLPPSGFQAVFMPARRLQPVSLQASCRMKRQLAGKSNSFLSLARSLTSHSLSLLLRDFSRLSKTKRKEKSREGKIHGKLNASWKISSLAVNGQSFLVIDGYLQDFSRLSASLATSSFLSSWQELELQPVFSHPAS